MSNRMSVLSRRLRSFAICFSFAALASFLVGMILTSDAGMTFTSNAARNEAKLFFAGFGALCFFAAFFLWLARGFAWAMVPEKPVEEKRFVEAKAVAPEKAVEEKKSVFVQEKVMASEKAAEEYAPQEYRPIQIEEYKPIQEYKPPQEYEPIQEFQPVQENVVEKKPAEEKAVAPEKPAEEKKRAKWWKKPKEEEAVYTITGRRIN
jgi:hypothetical protein